MNDLIKDDLKALVEKWNAGEPVRGIVLGHTVRVNKDGAEEPHVFRQKLAYECVFRVITAEGVTGSRPDFDFCETVAKEIAHELGMTPDEQVAALSLAWVALTIGWEAAIANHASHQYITLNRQAVNA